MQNRVNYRVPYHMALDSCAIESSRMWPICDYTLNGTFNRMGLSYIAGILGLMLWFHLMPQSPVSMRYLLTRPREHQTFQPSTCVPSRLHLMLFNFSSSGFVGCEKLDQPLSVTNESNSSTGFLIVQLFWMEN